MAQPQIRGGLPECLWQRRRGKAGIRAWLGLLQRGAPASEPWAIARRGKRTKHNAGGYADDRLCRPAAASPTPRARSKSGEMLAFAHIPTGTTTNTRIDQKRFDGKKQAPQLRSEPTSKSAGQHLKTWLRLSHDRGPPQAALPERLIELCVSIPTRYLDGWTGTSPSGGYALLSLTRNDGYSADFASFPRPSLKARYPPSTAVLLSHRQVSFGARNEPAVAGGARVTVSAYRCGGENGRKG